MNNFIPKNLFMVWLGDSIPTYVQFSKDAYEKANPSFNIQLIHFTVKQLEHIYYNKNAIGVEQILQKSMHLILQENTLINDNIYNKLFNHQKQLYKESIKLIQILSDIFRLMLISEYGGIYVDCDTFPLKPFDDKLLQLKCFTVVRHYNNIASNTENNIGNDNYFFGSMPMVEKYQPVKLLQTYNKWWISLQYIINKKRFFDLSLQYSPKLDQPLYIEHYCDGNWKLKNGRIRTQTCFLDEIYHGKQNNR